VAALQAAWAADAGCRALLDSLAGVLTGALADLGGVASVSELSDALLSALPSPSALPANMSLPRVGRGLLRVALDRIQALGRADEEATGLASRRRGGRLILLAQDAALLDPAEAVGLMADQLVEHAQQADEPVVPAARAIPRLQGTWAVAAGPGDSARQAPEGERLLRLAACLAQRAALSGALELHAADMRPATALRLALAGAASGSGPGSPR
jgi:hypothetical protein